MREIQRDALDEKDDPPKYGAMFQYSEAWEVGKPHPVPRLFGESQHIFSFHFQKENKVHTLETKEFLECANEVFLM
jgi:hypothetical protein